MRRIRIISVAVITGCMLFSVLPAFAKPLSPNYVQLKAGGFFPQAKDLDDFDSGGNIELGFGHYVAPGFVIEGDFGYFETSGRLVIPGIANVEEKFKVVPLTLSLKGQAFFDRFEPYAEAGIGVYFIEDRFNGTVLGVTGSQSENDVKIGYHIGLGGNFNYSPQVFLGLEGRYLWLRTDTFGVDVNLDGIVLSANIGYRF